MVEGISPLEAVERLRRFKEEMQLRERTVNMLLVLCRRGGADDESWRGNL